MSSVDKDSPTNPNSLTANRLRTYSTRHIKTPSLQLHRKASHDSQKKKFFVDVESTMQMLLEQEDTDRNFQINVQDEGPKQFTLVGPGLRSHDIQGHYVLSNLLQELTLAKEFHRKYIILDEQRLYENPVERLSRMIRNFFWDGLTRRIDGESLQVICSDPKDRLGDHKNRIYVPFDDIEALEYYQGVQHEKPLLDLHVERLPKDITPLYVKSINLKPGILALKLDKISSIDDSGHIITKIQGTPFVVPGGRFNEMYGWDSYFEALGLLVDNKVDLAKSMVDNFCYEIQHYGKIMNANRSYYLTRSQPPFLTDMAIQVFYHLPPSTKVENHKWLRHAIFFAIKEYYTVWMSLPRYDPVTTLSCYHPTGIKLPPETEASHFTHILEPFASKHNLSVSEFTAKYMGDEIDEPELDQYFIHDRAVRESGHDTTYRLESKCAHLATIDLNSLLFRYEVDIAMMIQQEFNGKFEIPIEWVNNSAIGTSNIINEHVTLIEETAQTWFNRAERRKECIDKYLWNSEKGIFFDYNIKTQKQETYESATTFWPLWAGLATEDQAQMLITKALPLFEVTGGLVSGTLASRGNISLERPNRQWDFPFGWAPHQILAWQGFERYGYNEIARKLAYRWLYTITKAFVDYSGVVPEKFDIVNMTHLVTVEYGNVGLDFKYMPKEGFGWMNASYQVGLTYLTKFMKRALGALTEPNHLFSLMNDSSKWQEQEQIGNQQVKKSFDNLQSLFAPFGQSVRIVSDENLLDETITEETTRKFFI
eukprot:NODE_661_length_5437_cov_0.370925.p1 type:complete len:765 gc:universal NODE_661_length_5437_cov_0.370925:546-2840(+)